MPGRLVKEMFALGVCATCKLIPDLSIEGPDVQRFSEYEDRLITEFDEFLVLPCLVLVMRLKLISLLGAPYEIPSASGIRTKLLSLRESFTDS